MCLKSYYMTWIFFSGCFLFFIFVFIFYFIFCKARQQHIWGRSSKFWLFTPNNSQKLTVLVNIKILEHLQLHNAVKQHGYIWWPYAFLSNCPLVYPLLPILALPLTLAMCHSGQGFLLPNLVAIGDFLSIWPLVDSGWPMHDLWPQQCI